MKYGAMWDKMTECEKREWWSCTWVEDVDS